jgi:hypothetical protein
MGSAGAGVWRSAQVSTCVSDPAPPESAAPCWGSVSPASAGWPDRRPGRGPCWPGIPSEYLRCDAAPSRRSTTTGQAGWRWRGRSDLRPAKGDLLPLGEGQVPTRKISSSSWTHPASRTHPRQPALTVGPGDRRRIGHELTTPPRSPKRLVQLSHELIRETDSHRNPHSIKCCDDRKDPRIVVRDDQPRSAAVALTCPVL